MKISIPLPGFDGVYYDTNAENTAATVALTAAGRKAPKPHGYAVQLLPYLWSFDVDLREVPNEHPLQYLHPEGARSLAELTDDDIGRAVSTDLETVLRFAWAVNQETEAAAKRALGRGEPTQDGTVIEIEDGVVGVDGDELGTDEFDFDAESGDDEFVEGTDPADSFEDDLSEEYDHDEKRDQENTTGDEFGFEDESES